MTDPRIEAAVSEWMRQINSLSIEKTGVPAKWTDPEITSNIRNAMTAALAAADTASPVRVVPMPIPEDQMRVARHTLSCWKMGTLTDEEAVSMIVCAVASNATTPEPTP